MIPLPILHPEGVPLAAAVPFRMVRCPCCDLSSGSHLQEEGRYLGCQRGWGGGQRWQRQGCRKHVPLPARQGPELCMRVPPWATGRGRVTAPPRSPGCSTSERLPPLGVRQTHSTAGGSFRPHPGFCNHRGTRSRTE